VYGLALLVLVLLAFFLQRIWVGGGSFITVTGKPASGALSPLPRWLEVSLTVLLVVWTLFVAALYLSIVVGSFAQLWGVNYTFTTRHYQDFMTAGWPVFLYTARIARSEEHTSELQSRENLVCRLLLEKKKDHRRR